MLPTDIAGLKVWLRPEGLAALADGAQIATWDNEGSLADATQGTAASRPLCKTGVASGYSVARFDGTDDWLALPDLSAMTAGTVFVVVKIANDPPLVGSKTGLWLFSPSGGEGHYPWTSGMIYAGFATTTVTTTVDPTPSLSSQFRVYCERGATNDWSNYLDGALLFSTATNTVAFYSAPRLGTYLGDFNLDGDIAELIVYDTALSATDRIAIESYLSRYSTNAAFDAGIPLVGSRGFSPGLIGPGTDTFGDFR